jgi:hypothetical protein
MGMSAYKLMAIMNYEPDAPEVDLAFGKPFRKSAISTESLLTFQQNTSWRPPTCATLAHASTLGIYCSRPEHRTRPANGIKTAESHAAPHRAGLELEPTGGDEVEDEPSLFGLFVAVRTGWDRILLRRQQWATPCPLCLRSTRQLWTSYSTALYTPDARLSTQIV